jgi:hypothetical protein
VRGRGGKRSGGQRQRSRHRVRGARGAWPWRHQSGGFLAHDLVFGATATDLPEDPAVDEVRAETKPGPALTRA